MIIWCPAVGMAWHRMGGARLSLLQTLRTAEAPMHRQAAELVHQASFLHGSLMGRAGLSWQHAGHWLLRAAQAMIRRRPLAHDPEASEDGAEDEGTGGTEGPTSGGLAVWRAAPSGDCEEGRRARVVATVRGEA